MGRRVSVYAARLCHLGRTVILTLRIDSTLVRPQKDALARFEISVDGEARSQTFAVPAWPRA